MMRSIVTLVGLLTISALACATEPAPAQKGSTQPAASSSTTAAQQTPSKPATGEPQLKVQPAKPENLKTAVKRAIKVFVPSEKIDVDKPVDFPTNI